jgi:DMSO/TMAO reductase YedYZ molybdopterin-dependent catalytic subunit
MKAKWSIAVAMLMVVADTVLAAEPKPVLAVTGEVPRPERYTLEQLQKLPIARIKARDQDGGEAEYAGVTVEELLRRAGLPLGEHLRGPALAKAVVVHAADGYQALLSLAEFDPGMTDRQTLLAWSRNNKPLPMSQGPLRLIVSGEKRPARWVRQVTAIEVISPNRPAITNATMSPLQPGRTAREKQ